MALVLVDAARMLGVGLMVGLLGAVALTNALRNQLFEVGPLDPIAVGTAVILLGGAGLVASWIPARRTRGFDPARLTRSD